MQSIHCKCFKKLSLSGWLLLLLTLIAVLSGCASIPTPINQTSGTISDTHQDTNPDVRQSVIEHALQVMGTPYKYGGASAQGFDCSGLVYYSYQQAGLQLPRTARHQFDSSRKISLREMQAGDLIFFHISARKPDHVGIYLGDNRFIHAPSTGSKVSTSRLDEQYWEKRVIGAGSYF